MISGLVTTSATTMLPFIFSRGKGRGSLTFIPKVTHLLRCLCCDREQLDHKLMTGVYFLRLDIKLVCRFLFVSSIDSCLAPASATICYCRARTASDKNNIFIFYRRVIFFESGQKSQAIHHIPVQITFSITL